MVERLYDLVKGLILIPYEIETQLVGLFVLEDCLYVIVVGYLGQHLVEKDVVESDSLLDVRIGCKGIGRDCRLVRI